MKRQLLFLLALMLCSIGMVKAQEVIFSANPTTAWSVPASTADAEITSSYATISGGKMYVTNEQTSAKDLIKKQGELAFQMTNNNTFFKIVLYKALEAGDVISARMQSRTDTDLGIWFSTASERPNEVTAKINLPTATSQAWVEAPTYTVAEDDGICGETTIYLYRGTGKSTFFNTFTITRPDKRTDVKLTFSSTTASATLGEAFTAPTLTVDPTAAASEVVYSSSNTAVATVDASTGAVVLKAGGVTDITATISNSDSYQDASASYTLTVTDPNVTAYDNEAANIEWPFQDGTTVNAGTVSPEDAFLSASVNFGSLTLGNTSISFKDDESATQYTFNTLTNSTGSSVSNINVDFVVTPMDGITFKPTNVYFEAARIGHNNGKITVKAIYGDRTEKTLMAEHEVARNNTTGFSIYTTDDIDITDGVESANPFTLRISINKLDNGKADAFRNIKISGLVNGAPSAVNIYTITAEPNDPSLGTVVGGDEYAEGSEVTLTATASTGAQFVKWQKDGEDIEGEATITFTASANAVYTAFFQKLYAVSFSAGDGDKGTTPNALATEYVESSYTTPAKNYYVSKEGYTVTGWTDGTNEYGMGEEFTVTGDITLQPIFTANTVSLDDDRASDLKVTWDFTGTPALNIEKATGYYVVQGTVNGETIDIPMYINNASEGKTNNVTRNGDTQINKNSTFTIPAVQGMTVVITAKSNTISTTTVGGATPSSGSGSKSATYVYNGTNKTVDIVFGDDGKYYLSIVVTYPANVVNVTFDKDLKYASFYYSNSAYTIPEGVTAYYVESINNRSINLQPIEGVIPAKCAVVLEYTEGELTKKFVKSASTVAAPANLLRGSDKAETTTGEDESKTYKFYALSNGSKGVGFYFMVDGGAAFTNAAHKAYLAVEKDGTTEANFIGLFDTDGIDQMVVRKADADAPAYNLAGQRVSDNYRGVVIVNGVKSIRK